MTRGQRPAAEFALIHGGVGVAHEIEHSGEGDGGVQVVCERGVKIFFRALAARSASSAIRARWKFSVFQARDEIAQAFDGACGLLQAVDREIELATVRNARAAESGASKACSLC